MRYGLRLTSLLFGSALLLAACVQANSGTGSTDAAKPAPPADAAATPTLPAPSLTPNPSVLASPKAQTYREKDGLFEISFPHGYTHQTTGSGVAFVSPDQSFAGAVDFASAGGSKLTPEQLETALKADFRSRLKSVSWQESKKQPDGSLRIDWTGKDKKDNTLDAVSIVEQRGSTIFVLNLFGVNKPYQNYNKDAEAIVNSYRVRSQ
jgi:hypothetical protein